MGVTTCTFTFRRRISNPPFFPPTPLKTIHIPQRKKGNHTSHFHSFSLIYNRSCFRYPFCTPYQYLDPIEHIPFYCNNVVCIYALEMPAIFRGRGHQTFDHLTDHLRSGIFGYINYLVEKDRKYILDTLVNGKMPKLPLLLTEVLHIPPFQPTMSFNTRTAAINSLGSAS